MKLAAFLIILTIVRLVAIGHMELSPDEAYYHEWSKQLDWCYYSKGPGVAVAMRASTELLGHGVFAIRFFAPVLALGTSLILFWLARRMYDERVAFWAVGLMNLTPLFNAGGLMMTIDPLSIFFWVAAMATVWQALEHSGGNEPRFSLWWPLSGLLIGAGFLCKWTNGLQLLSILLLLLLTPRCRKELLRPGFWSMFFVALLALIPVGLWQSANGWPVLAHLLSRGGLQTPWWKIDYKDFGAFIASHFGVYSPILFLGMMIALWSEVRASFERWAGAVARSVPAIPRGLRRHWLALVVVLFLALALYFAGNFWDEYPWLHKGAFLVLILGALLGIYQCKAAANVHWRARYLAAYSVPIFLLYLWVSLHHDSEVNWTAPGMVGLFILVVAHYLDRVSPRLVQWTCGLAVAISVIGAQPDLVRAVGIPWPANRDHTTRTRGWAESTRAVERVRTELEQQLKLERPIFLIGENYGVAAELCYYLSRQPPLPGGILRQAEGPRHPLCYVPEAVVAENQFYYWGRYDEYVQRNIPPNLINKNEDSAEFGVCPFAGRTAIYVTTRKEGDPPDILKDTFADWQFLRDVDIKEEGRPLRTLRFFLCHRYLPGQNVKLSRKTDLPFAPLDCSLKPDRCVCRMDVMHQRLLVAAQGYSELGLPELALGELALIPEDYQHEPVVVESRLSILMQARRFREALPHSQELCRLQPERTAGFIHAAFCLHEMGNTFGARELLLSGPSALKAEPTYHYNLACYEAALGNLDEARAHLDVSFAMDKKLREHARTDPDLRPLNGVGAS